MIRFTGTHQYRHEQHRFLPFEYPATILGNQKVFISWIICVCIKLLKAWDLSIRWTALDRRLSATEEKIEKIQSGALKPELLAVTAAKCAEGACECPEGEAAAADQVPAPAFGTRSKALPIDRAAIQAEKADSTADADAAVTAESAVDDMAAAHAFGTVPMPSDTYESAYRDEACVLDEETEEEDPWPLDPQTGVPEWLIRRMFVKELSARVRTDAVFEAAPPGS